MTDPTLDANDAGSPDATDAVGAAETVGAGDAAAPETPDAADTTDTVEAPSHFAQLRDRFTRSEAQLEAKYDDLKTRRDESAPIDIAFRVVEADRRVAGGLISGGMAFRIFVVLVPFAFVIVTVLGILGKAIDANNPTALAKDLGMTGLVASAIGGSARLSTWETIVTLLVATYALLWGTWNLVRAVRAVNGLAWELPELPHFVQPWRWTLITVGSLSLGWLLAAGASRLSDTIDPMAELVARLLFFGVVVAVWIAASWVLPRAPGTGWRAMIPGAVLFGVGLEGLQFLTVYFFSRYIESKTQTYGAIGASVAILLWAYFLGRIIVTSAFLNAARWRSSQRAVEAQKAPSDGTNGS